MGLTDLPMKSILPRWFFVPALVLALLAATPLIHAEDSAPAKEKPLSKAKEKHDTDKDGKLSDAEKAEMKEEAKEKSEEKKKEILAKYDANHNGQLDPDEKEKAKADHEAEKAAHRAELEKRKTDHEAKKAEKAAKDAPK